MKKFKFIIAIAATALLQFLPVSLHAAENVLYLYHISGQIISISLDKTPSILIDNGSLSIANQSFDIKDISKYTFDKPTGTSDIAFSSQIMFENNNTVILPAGTTAANFSIADMKGIVYPVPLAATADHVSADMSSLAPGVYILSCRDYNLKFCKL